MVHTHQSPPNIKESDEECYAVDTPVQVYAVCSIFAIGVTIALIIKIGFIKGAVSDHERCTALTEKVLRDHGSSVVAALCLGVVHPHVSGVGGGGVMLIHNACWNQTEVINFQGSAPKTLTEDVVQNASDIKVSYLHTLWDDVVSRVADVARDGFNVSQSWDILIPNGQTLRLRLGSYPRMPSLAEVLEAGLGTFIEEKVQGNGGVLTREEIHNYTVEVQQPMEGHWTLYIIQVSPPPSVGAVLISAPNLEQCFSTIFGPLTGQVEVMGPDDLMVSVASSLSGPFVGRIITESGVILKSLILDFFWPNQRTGQPQSNQARNSLELGKRPLTFLRPAVMVLTWNKCGTYMALSISAGLKSLE
ncbi:gamma-glutamyltransferase 7-like [Poecilia latipinna]|uniref:gamma-glutamyltransferase 7-like n=1 Tax=Poecilia latipinna TaxID=48699 RepID=UPI00072E7EC1|nr:PREDICTED: gamma-glutamyltransferase 7-like [Poecilia latipinna]